MPLYAAFGLCISSDIEFPELLSADYDTPDVEITAGDVNLSGLNESRYNTVYAQAKKDILWMHVPHIAWFQVSFGRKIVYMPDGDVDQDSIRLHLLGSCMGAVLHQRRYLVMNGNAICFGGQCAMFVGPSGSGKSTLAAAFHKRGYPILADDVCAIDREQRVIPAYPQLKLWHDTADKLDIDVSKLRQVRSQIKKYAYPLKQGFCSQALPLVAVYCLSTHNRDEIIFDAISGMKRFAPLKNNTYRLGYIEGLGLQTELLSSCSALANKVYVKQVSRPDYTFELDTLIERCLEDLKEKAIIL